MPRARLLAVAAGVLLATGCGDPDVGWQSDRGAGEAGAAAQTAPADAAMRRAAASLSVANAGAPQEEDAWAQAVQCAAAVEASAEALRASPLVGEAEYREIQRAGRIFAERAEALAAGGDHSAEETRDRLAEARSTAGEDPQLALRTALGCLRSLAGAT